MGLMDDFQWRRTDGTLRGDGGGLDVGEGLRCVADKCLNFCYYRLCAAFVEYFFATYDSLSDITGIQKQTLRILKHFLTSFPLNIIIYNYFCNIWTEL